LLHLYSTFLGTQSALHRRGESPQPPPMCTIHLDDASAAIIVSEHPTDTSLLMERRQWWIQLVWGWLGGHDGQKGQIWPGCQGYTPTW